MDFPYDSKYAEHLSKMVQFPTVSTTNDENTDWKPLQDFQNYLRETYPLVHSRMSVTKIGNGSLLFHLKSEHPTHRPVLIMSHQDVVPAGDASRWTYPPFSGKIADGKIWGRGSIDCKALVMAEMETVEALLKEGFAPNYDLYIALGHNEEVEAAPDVKGSKLTVAFLKEHSVKLGCLFDEGGKVLCGKDNGYSEDLAQVSLGEKASVNFVIYKDGKGGHAMKPGKGTLLGSIGRAIAAIEANPMPYRLIPITEAQLKASAGLQPEKIQEIYADPQHHWDELCRLARDDIFLDGLLHTTFAVTMASGSSISNVLPTHAECTVNVRILQGDTIDSVTEYLKSILPADVKIKCMGTENPRPVGSAESREFKLLEDVLSEIYDGHIKVVPSLLLGGTDSRNYTEICDNVFKFGGGYNTAEYGQTHQIDEHIPVSVLGASIQFLTAYLKAYQNL